MRILTILCGLLLSACNDQHSTVVDSQIHAYQKAQSVEQFLLQKEQADQEKLKDILQ